MKISHILLAIVVAITLTGMVATDMLLKQQYNKIDWRNPYQNFERRALPTAKHWVVEGTLANEIIIERSKSKPQALVGPGQIKFYQTRQQGDTVFVTLTSSNDDKYQTEPRAFADYTQSARLVLQVPDLQTLRVRNVRLTLEELATDKLLVILQRSLLRTKKVTVSDSFSLTASQNSFAVLGADQYQSLQLIVQDSSGIQLNNTQVNSFTKDVSPKAEVQLRGQSLKWLK